MFKRYERKRYFEVWQRLSYDNVTWSMQYYENYIGAVQIFQLDEEDNIMYGVELVEAFPKNYRCSNTRLQFNWRDT